MFQARRLGFRTDEKNLPESWPVNSVALVVVKHLNWDVLAHALKYLDLTLDMKTSYHEIGAPLL